MKRSWSLVGRAVWVTDVVTQLLEATLANFFQLTTLQPGGRFAVVVDGDAQLLPQARAEGVGELNTDAHRQVGERHEGHDVRGAHPRVLPAMLPHVDPFRRDGGAGHRRVDGTLGF